MEIKFKGRCLKVNKGEKGKFVDFGDMDTFSPVNVQLPLNTPVEVGKTYDVTLSASFARGKNGVYLSVTDCAAVELKNEGR